jgi:hypothetical protein
MHEFKRGQLHSGTGKKGRKGKIVKNRAQAIAIGLSYVEKLIAMGYSEEAALTFAKFAYNEPLALGIASGMIQTAAFVDSQRAADVADEGPTSDIDSTPGNQKGSSGRRKQSQQRSSGSFPTLPKETDSPYSEGPMVKARDGKCPTGTRSVGGGFCKNPKAGRRQYFDIEKGKGCPPGSKPAGKGRCRVDFAESRPSSPGGAQSTTQSTDGGVNAIDNTPCPEKKSPAEKQAEKAEQGTQPTPETPPEAKTTEPAEPPTAEDLEKKRVAKERAERCAKQAGN